MDTKELPRLVFFSEEDDGYIATIPGLPMVSAFGTTEASALRELKTALAGHRRAAEQAGEQWPGDLPSDTLTRAAAVLNLSELARRIGIKQSALAMRLSRGTGLSPEETSALHATLRESGLALVAP